MPSVYGSKRGEKERKTKARKGGKPEAQVRHVSGRASYPQFEKPGNSFYEILSDAPRGTKEREKEGALKKRKSQRKSVPSRKKSSWGAEGCRIERKKQEHKSTPKIWRLNNNRKGGKKRRRRLI